MEKIAVVQEAPVFNTPVGKVGTLLCWENYMPLARYALYGQGVQLYVAPTYDCGDAWILAARNVGVTAILPLDIFVGSD